jgi:hypothetical protein
MDAPIRHSVPLVPERHNASLRIEVLREPGGDLLDPSAGRRKVRRYEQNAQLSSGPGL